MATTTPSKRLLSLSGQTVTSTDVMTYKGLTVATEEYVSTAISNLVDSAPGTLNTLNELAAALGDDINFSSTVSNNLAKKLSLTGGSLSGGLTLNNVASDKKLVFKRTSGKSISIEHDVNQIYFYNETDAEVLFQISNAGVTTAGDGFTSTKGNTAYGWGNHASASYLTTTGKAADSNLLDGIDSSAFIRENQDRRHKVIRFTGENGESGNGSINYGIYQESGAWTHPYPDLVIAMHTGIKIGGKMGYGGTRFYSDAPGREGAAELFSVGNGDGHVRVANNLIVAGTVVGSNFSGSSSGTNTGDQDLSGYLLNTSDTLTGDLTVTGDIFVDGKITQGGVIDREEWGRTYADTSITNIKELLTSDGTSLPTGGGYRVTGHIDGTGTDQVAVAIFWNQNGVWKLNNTFKGDSTSNHIDFLISGGLPSVKTWHTSNYNINVSHERLSLNEDAGTDNLRGYFGSDSYLQWTESGNSLVIPGTVSATNLSGTNTGDQDLSGYLLNTSDTLTGDLIVTGQGVFAGAIKITETGTAQHILIGNQDSGGTDKPSMIQGVNGKLNFGYGSSWTGEGGTITTTLSLSSSGNATFAGDVTATNLSGTNTGDQDLGSYITTSTADGKYLLNTTDTFTGVLTISGSIKGSGQELILNAGEASSYATGQGDEYIYLNAEQGIQVNSDNTGNWQTGWAARKTAYLRGDQLSLDGETINILDIQQFKLAYGWGNHASEGYIKSYVDTTYTAGTGLKLSGTEFRLNGGGIGASVDLDTYRTTGIFAQNSNSATATGSNYPENKAGVLEVWNDDYGNGLHCTQRYKTYSGINDWSRAYYNGSWSTWVNLTKDTVYLHPTSAGNKHIPTGGAAGQFLKYSSSGTAVWAADNNTQYSIGDGGLTTKNFTAALKTKLDGIEAGAKVDQDFSSIFNNAHANYSMSGGGIVTWSGSNLSWSSRIICIPVPKALSSNGHIDIVPKAAINIPAWHGLYWKHTKGSSNVSGTLEVIDYNSSLVVPDDTWLLIAQNNGDTGSLKWMPGVIILPNDTNYNSDNGIASWQTGPTGPKGDDGERGVPGSNGTDGDDGRNGTDGTNGTDGAKGDPGPKGDPGNTLDVEGNSNNRIITATGGTTVQAESTLTYTAGSLGMNGSTISFDGTTMRFIV